MFHLGNHIKMVRLSFWACFAIYNLFSRLLNTRNWYKWVRNNQNTLKSLVRLRNGNFCKKRLGLGNKLWHHQYLQYSCISCWLSTNTLYILHKTQESAKNSYRSILFKRFRQGINGSTLRPVQEVSFMKLYPCNW